MYIFDKLPFIPRDKPKSWVLGTLAALAGLLVAIPTIVCGIYFKLALVWTCGITLLLACWLTFTVAWLIYVIGAARGKYKHLQEREWSKQLW